MGNWDLKGYFRFSKYLDHQADLSAWANWFSARGIRCLIKRRKLTNRKGKMQYGFALWRKGKEVLAQGTKEKTENLSGGEIIWQGPAL